MRFRHAINSMRRYFAAPYPAEAAPEVSPFVKVWAGEAVIFEKNERDNE